MIRLFMLFSVLCYSPLWAQRKAVFIIVDGIPADVIEQLRPPTLFEIAGTQGYTRAFVGGEKGGYSESPTISAVGYNHVLTGTWTNKHNVWDNDIKDPNYHYWNVFRIAQAANPQITTAIFSTWLDNRTKLAGDHLPEAGNISIDYAFDGYEKDTTRFPHKKDSKYISDIDEYVSTQAANTIATKAPDLSWVYLEFTDDMGHAFGDSPQFHDAIKKTDQRLARIWQAVQARQREHGEDWLVIITTDHGRSALDGKGHGGQSDRERTTWIVTNARNTNEHFHALPGAVDIAPTLLRHLNLEIPQAVKMEMDGIPLIGPLSLYNVKATRNGNAVTVRWQAAQGAHGNVEVFEATTNTFATGRTDDYQRVAIVDVNQQSVSFPITNTAKRAAAPARQTRATANTGKSDGTMPESAPEVIKFVVKGSDNWATAWWVKN